MKNLDFLTSLRVNVNNDLLIIPSLRTIAKQSLIVSPSLRTNVKQYPQSIGIDYFVVPPRNDDSLNKVKYQ